MQQITANISMSTDVQTVKTAKRGQPSEKSKSTAQKSKRFTETLEQFSALFAGQTTENKLKTVTKGQNTGGRSGDVSPGQLLQRSGIHEVKNSAANSKLIKEISNKVSEELSSPMNFDGEMQLEENYKTKVAASKIQLNENNSAKEANEKLTVLNDTGSGAFLKSLFNETELIPGNVGGEKLDIPGNTRSQAKQSGEKTEVDRTAKEKANPLTGAPEMKVSPESAAVKSEDPNNTETVINQNTNPKAGMSQDFETVFDQRTNSEKVEFSKQMDALISKMTEQVKTGPSSLEVSLKPEYLGKLNILVESNGGLVSVKLIAQSGETAQLLHSNLQNMKDSLEQQGIKLQQMDIDLANQGNSDSQRGTRDQNRQQGQAKYVNRSSNYEMNENREYHSMIPSKLNLLA